MARIERYLAREILRPVVGVLVFLLVVVLLFYSSRYLAQAALERLPLVVVGEMAALRLAIFLDVLVPAALCLGIVLGLGRLQANHEVTALAAAGVGRWRYVAAIIWTAVGLALVVGLFSTLVRPLAYAQLYELESSLAVRVDLERVEPGRFEIGDEQWLIFAERSRGARLEEVLVQQRLPEYQNLLKAEYLHQETGQDAMLRLVFSGNVQTYRLDRTGGADVIGRFESLQVLFTPPPAAARDRRRRARDTFDLIETGEPLARAELQWRLSGPVSVLVLALAGIALSRIKTRQGQSARILSASLFIAAYFTLLGTLMNWLELERIPPWPGMFWLPLALLAVLALRYWVLLRRPGAPL